jgi:hypothetical protein
LEVRVPDLQSSSGPPSSAFPSSGFPSGSGPNGFDFGLSSQKTGLGYGLLGDLSTLKASMGDQNCDDCPPDEPCPSCQGAGPAPADGQGQIIKAQAPFPLPGLIPPPPVGLLPPSPSGPVVIGRPNDWWNWTPGEVGDWIKGWVHAQPSQEVEEMCWEQYERDTINCNIKKAYAGAAAAQVCHAQAAKAYADCRRKGRKSDIPRYDRN